jgi:zinc protease
VEQVTVDRTRGEVDGVPVLAAPASGGDVTVGLVFRVGSVDETIPERGITRLAARMACTGLDARVHATSEVGAATTSIVLRGPGDAVGDALEVVCRRFADLPTATFEAVRAGLRGGPDRRPGLVDRHLRWRYGNATWGLGAHGEHGLARLDAATVAAWASARFTAGAAVLWVLGSVPAALRLPLPSGARTHAPRGTPTHRRRVAVRGGDIALLTLEVPAGPVAGLAAAVLGRATRRRLRGTDAEVEHGLAPLDGGRTLLVVGVEVADADPTIVVDELLSALGVLAVAGPERAEISGALEDLIGVVAARSAEDELAAAAVDELLTGADVTTPDRIRAWADVSLDDIRTLFEHAHGTAQLSVPDGVVRLDGRYGELGRIVPPPDFGATRVGGGHPDRVGDRLHVSDTGVFAYEASTGTAVTVPWNACAGVLRDDGGVRIVLGLDDTVVPCIAEQWRGGAGLVAAIDAFAPAGLLVDRAG